MIQLSETNYFQPNQLKSLSLNKIKNIHDLLLYVPRRYVDRSKPLILNETKIGDTITFIGKVISSEIKYSRKRRLVIKCKYQNWYIDLVFFQAIHYYQKSIRSGMEVAFSGNLDYFAGKFNIIHPEFEILTGDELIHTGKIVPIYKTTENMRNNFITSKVLRNAIHQILKVYFNKIEDYILEAELKKMGILMITDALKKIHFPELWEDVKMARNRLAFDEILIFSIIMHQKKLERSKICKEFEPKKFNKEWKQNLIQSLPFELTLDQKNAIQKLQELAKQKSPFGALLQGDVGSGKTLVAFALALEYIEEGIQVAFIAPTEILARQHYQSILNFLSHLPFLPIECFLGREKPSEKKVKLQRIAKRDTLMVIGTHSLLQEKLEFAKLGLVIIDEQHRFGVEQREALRSKGKNPDLLAMTATPIPRSLTLTYYGDLETILIQEKPKNRLAVDTRLFPELELERLYKGIKKYVNQKRQAYIVYPIIDESEKKAWASLKSDYDHLEKNVFTNYTLGLLHGQLSSEEKEKTMRQFKEGRIQILVCTTVVEVGVDVPNATVIMIRNAEKFGLSQLHQLRGRVGRGAHQSFCILVHSLSITKEAEQRLNAMVSSNDGFFLAQKDLEIRGAGELLGIKQAGFSEFRIADLRYHHGLVEKAKQLLKGRPDIMEKVVSQKDWKTFLKKGMVLFTN